ncbi:tigger transposable element-derived protein 6-like [Diprion similis]|uniref:tigger transposable element-derived protein 6-like n=1 Tax=Diprion similis TaxID=362088 RepID=UPI001EF7ADAE|nr:tigger transposable element-derived protein 6-like [Diprion similis]
MTSKRKLKSLSIGEKIRMIEIVKTGSKTKKDIAEEFGIPTSTLSTILKNEVDLMQKISADNLDRKRNKATEFPDLEECLIKWFKQCRDQNVSVGGPILKEKAEAFAKSLGHENFRASNGWLQKLKKRHNIAFRKLCGESASVNDDVCSEWKTKLKLLLKDYEPQDVFNADDTALFYKCLPDKTLTFKNEKCRGGKHSKERVTLLLAANMTGTDKLKPPFIGKSKKPRCFAGCNSFPMDYTANKKAWMNAELFKEWLIKIDNQMKKAKRKIFLFMNNCTAHNIIPASLQCVKVQFLPPNTTSKLQPLDQGIIKNFKTLYRKEVVRQIVSDIEDGKKTSIDILQAMRMADESWRNVTKKTIENCFKTCGFCSQAEDDLEVEPEPVLNDDIEANCKDTNENDVDEDENDEEPIVAEPPVSLKQAKTAFITVRNFIEKSINIDDNVFAALFAVENAIDCQHKLKQSKVTDFFQNPVPDSFINRENRYGKAEGTKIKDLHDS